MFYCCRVILCLDPQIHHPPGPYTDRKRLVSENNSELSEIQGLRISPTPSYSSTLSTLVSCSTLGPAIRGRVGGDLRLLGVDVGDGQSLPPLTQGWARPTPFSNVERSVRNRTKEFKGPRQKGCEMGL